MSLALDDGGVRGAGGACRPMEGRGCVWVGTFRAGAKGQSAERADAAVVRQGGAPDCFQPGNRLDDLGSMSPGGGAQSVAQLLSPGGCIWGACSQEAWVSRADAPARAVRKVARFGGI